VLSLFLENVDLPISSLPLASLLTVSSPPASLQLVLPLVLQPAFSPLVSLPLLSSPQASLLLVSSLPLNVLLCYFFFAAGFFAAGFFAAGFFTAGFFAAILIPSLVFLCNQKLCGT
jgi:hypothetical protein